MKSSRFIATFDSASGMLRATARTLRGEEFPALGSQSVLARATAPLVNWLPRPLRQQVYKLGGWNEAVSARRVEEFDAEAVARWIVDHYPRRRYPAALIGSSNGAAVHLAAALGIPWLPQTLLIPVRRRGVHPDDMQAGMEAGMEPGHRLLTANPQLQLHHMHDANQDRLMIQKMMYFRVKYRHLSAAYMQFLEQSLAPGATLFVVDCQLTWPTTEIARRHYFQAGALGGVHADEVLCGSPRVREFLARSGSPRQKWEPPEPDAKRPEAEWGFEPTLLDHLQDLAERRELRLCRITFPHPEDLSPLVADLYRWWYRQRGLPADRLLVESFILLEPMLALKKGQIPYWSHFAVKSAADRLENYLNRSPTFQDISVMLFSHGVESAGYVPIERWRELMSRAKGTGRFLGVSEQAYPRDFAAFKRYHQDLKQLPDAAAPAHLSLEDLDRFLAESAGRYQVEWSDVREGPRPHHASGTRRSS